VGFEPTRTRQRPSGFQARQVNLLDLRERCGGRKSGHVFDMIKLSCGLSLTAQPLASGLGEFRLRHRGKARVLSASLLGELHNGGDVGGVVLYERSQDALELLVAEHGALLAEHGHINGAVG
jgi:hypothetical protein